MWTDPRWLFSNWKFGFDSDPRLHDVQPSCTLWRTDTIVIFKLNSFPSQISPQSLLSPPPPSNGLEINKPPLPGRGLNRGFKVLAFAFFGTRRFFQKLLKGACTSLIVVSVVAKFEQIL